MLPTTYMPELSNHSTASTDRITVWVACFHPCRFSAWRHLNVHMNHTLNTRNHKREAYVDFADDRHCALDLWHMCLQFLHKLLVLETWRGPKQRIGEVEVAGDVSTESRVQPSLPAPRTDTLNDEWKEIKKWYKFCVVSGILRATILQSPKYFPHLLADHGFHVFSS